MMQIILRQNNYREKIIKKFWLNLKTLKVENRDPKTKKLLASEEIKPINIVPTNWHVPNQSALLRLKSIKGLDKGKVYQITFTIEYKNKNNDNDPIGALFISYFPDGSGNKPFDLPLKHVEWRK